MGASLLGGALFVAPTPAAAETAANDVAVLAGPSGDSATLSTAAAGTLLSVDGEIVDGYVPVTVDGVSGWIPAGSVGPDPGAAEAAPGEAAPVEEAVYEEPATEEAVYEEPVYEEPVSGEPIYEEPVYEEPPYQEPVNEEPIYEEPVSEEPVYEEPAAEAAPAEAVYEEPAPEAAPAEAPPAEPAPEAAPLPDPVVSEAAAAPAGDSPDDLNPPPGEPTSHAAPSSDYARQDVVGIIRQAAADHGQNPEAMIRVAKCESGLNPNAVGGGAYYGLFQFVPSTFAATPYGGGDIFDPWANAQAAGWMWAQGRKGEWTCQ